MQPLRNIIMLSSFLFYIAPFGFVIAGDGKESIAPKSSITGYVKDAKNGELLVGATVSIRSIKEAVATNSYGYYSLTVVPGKYTIEYSYVGYITKSVDAEVTNNVVINTELSEEVKELNEVIITTNRHEDKIKRAEMSVEHLEMKQIKKIPALLGEVDVVKALQLLPGVLSTSEGSSNFSVRGGNADQNLMQLDEATVYNPSHLMGFFSVFNNDAIKDVTLYKGDIPASAGGRLSSFVDVRMKDGDMKKHDVTGGIGLISSRLTIEGPIIQDKSSFMIAGRRTYVDIFFPLLSHFTSQGIKNAKLYFYDLNGKANYTFGNNDRIYLSAYLGNDLYGNDQASFGYGNATYTLRWNHIYSPRLFSNLSLIRNKYDYQLGNGTGTINSFLWTSSMDDYALKLDYMFFLNPENTVKFGVTTIMHEFLPGDVTRKSNDTASTSFHLKSHHALEHGIYISNEQKVNDNLTLKYGLRFSGFQNMGPDYIYNFNNNYTEIDSTVYRGNKIFHSYWRLEPRFGANYKVDEISAVKASYARTAQYMQLASSSAAGTPLDIWFSSSPNVKPQLADQFAVGYIRNLYHNAVEASVELYYKKIVDLIDFKDNATLLFNDKLDGELRYGDGQAYGIELMLQLFLEKTNGWISYTYSHVTRRVKGLADEAPNDYTTYLSPFDKSHAVNVVLNRQLTKRLTISATWVYSTGVPVTLPAGRYVYQNVIMPIYTSRNSYRMPDYHRLDLSLSLKQLHRPFNLWDGEWVFSVYNAYDRHNTWAINFEQDMQKPNVVKAVKRYLFAVIPAITYNFKF
jgi:hypothetical protein